MEDVVSLYQLNEGKQVRVVDKTELRLQQALARFSSQPNDGLVDVRVVAALLGRSTASVWRDAANGRLSKPIKVGGSTRWRVGDVRAALRGGGGNVVGHA